MTDAVSFCPYCGERLSQQDDENKFLEFEEPKKQDTNFPLTESSPTYKF